MREGVSGDQDDVISLLVCAFSGLSAVQAAATSMYSYCLCITQDLSRSIALSRPAVLLRVLELLRATITTYHKYD